MKYYGIKLHFENDEFINILKSIIYKYEFFNDEINNNIFNNTDKLFLMVGYKFNDDLMIEKFSNKFILSENKTEILDLIELIKNRLNIEENFLKKKVNLKLDVIEFEFENFTIKNNVKNHIDYLSKISKERIIDDFNSKEELKNGIVYEKIF